ncbi:cytochrome c oxidase subunit 4 [Sanguibacter sp. HDW7]|uniref:cytochrome c oxidase subunit 4 n=1 Tax=Sanguibacter sp. HDW7 TaxID=2714931 RepID=UPI00140E90F7|nr:cytochrome c oxidase subunit 4 [Sanguibacter sp. HDW7]QIK83711.1 cytochrome c oxidase subunit 4 [Sanguibacter sp. HDW7]
MKIETRLFAALVPFFLIVALAYGLTSSFEPVGTAALFLLAGLVGMIAGYLWLTARHIDARPEDDPEGEIAEGAGELGTFAPWSWWPLVLAIAASICFLGLAAGWWVFYIGAGFSVIAVTGWVMEYSRGIHAH